MIDLTNLSAVVADDHPLLLQGLKATLINGGVNVVGAASDGSEALKLIEDHRPEVAVLDIEMPYLTGFAVADECRKKGLPTKFVILSYHKEAEFIAQAKSLHIAGYLLKEDTNSEIFKCLEKVALGEFYYSPSILNKDLSMVSENLKRLELLSPSERKILKLIASQLSSQAIADKLHVSERTVEKHRSNIIGKLALSGHAHSLSIWAIEQKAVIISL
ncbi:MAG: response regulator [Imperialibacter sp.]|uniref:response regulator n=1 Tax=Imperialibacter sp. TaxID=2038411 RepID=UPI003A8595E3